MSDIGLFLTFARELLSRTTQSRAETPSAALSVDLIERALRGSGDTDGAFAAGYAFHTANIANTIFGATTCLDLGAAPGCQLIPLATLLPDTQFIGVDRSTTLIADGKARSKEKHLANITWVEDDITALSTFEDGSCDAVISTMTLHDLPTISAVNDCLNAAARVLKPDGAIYIEDYGRLKSPKSVAYFNRECEAQRDDFQVLNRCSLLAAHQIGELRAAFETHFPQAKLYSTFVIPFLNVAKTPARSLSVEVAQELKSLRARLNPGQRKDLDDLRKFFRLGGWATDPFDI